MDLIKHFGLVFLVFTVFVPFEFIKSQGIVLFKLYKCISNDEFVLPNSTCYAKPYNRTTSTINEFIYLKKPCSDFSVSLNKKYRKIAFTRLFQIEVTFAFMYGTIYREVMKLLKFDACKILNNTAQDNILLFHFKQVLGAGTVWDHVHCTYTVKSWCKSFKEFYSNSWFQEFVLRNHTLDFSFFPAILPTGDYKVNLFYTRNKGQSMLKKTCIFTLILQIGIHLDEAFEAFDTRLKLSQFEWKNIIKYGSGFHKFNK